MINIYFVYVFACPPVIANRPKTLPYLEALLPKDEDITSQEEEAARAAGGPQMPTPAPLPSEVPPPAVVKPEPDKAAPAVPPQTPEPKADNPQVANTSATETTDTDNQIDNPYLRAITMPKLKGGGKKHKW